MADYTNAIKKLEEMRKEREGNTTPPSSVLSGQTNSGGKDYSAAIERMRANQIKRKEEERPYAQLDTLRERFSSNPARLPTVTEKVNVEFEDGTSKKLNKDLVADLVIGRDTGDHYWIPGTPYSSSEDLQREIDKIKSIDKPAAGEKYENALKYYDRDSEEVKNAFAEFEGMDAKIKELEEKIKLRKEYDKYVEYMETYAPLMNNADFRKNSQYVSTYRGGEEKVNGMYVDTGFEDIEYDYINRDKTARERKALLNVNSNASLFGVDNSERLEMSDNEIKLFNYIYKTQSPEAAYDYVNFITTELNERERANAEKEWEAYAKEHPVGASVFSVITSPLKGISYVGQFGSLLKDGEIDPNAAYNKFNYIPSAIRNEVSKTVEKNWGSAGSFMYDIGMSMGDFLMSSAVSGGNSTLAMLILGTGSAADTTLDALDRGLSSEDAFLLGTAAGAIEMATEKMSMDALFGKIGKKLSKSEIVQFIISNIGSEAGEEAISEVANTIADAIIAEDKSYWEMAVQSYIDQGYDEDKAIAKALLDKLGDVGLAALGGGISGFGLSGGGVALNLAGSAVQNAENKAAGLSNKYAAQETIRKANLSDELKNIKTEQQNNTVLPKFEDIERQEARERGEVFEIGYEKPYSQYADTAEDIDLKARIDAAETITEKTGLRHGASEQQIADALELGRALGREVEFFTQKSADGKTVKDGFYNPQNGHIYVNVNAKKALETTLSHEFTHSLEKTTSYKALEELARDTMARNGEDFDLAIEAAKKTYEAAKVDYAADDASIKAEVIANFVEKYVLGDKKSILEISKARPSFARKVKMWLTNLLSKLAPKSNSNVYATVKQINDMYSSAVSSSAEKAVTADAVVKNAFEGEEKGKTKSTESAEEKTTEEVKQDKETRAENKNAATGDSDTSERVSENKAKPKEKASAKAETKTAATESPDTDTMYLDEAEEFMRQAEEDLAEGRITEEEFEERERYYEELYASGGNIAKSSEGFSTEGFFPKFRRSPREALGFSVSYSVSQTNDSVKEQLKNNSEKLNTMEPVANINYDVVNRGQARNDADDIFKKAGYKIDRQGFGIIEIGPKQLSESSKYLNEPAEFAAWMTIPKVLKQGVEISDHADHKKRGFSSVTIAAPVIINNKRGNVAVVVQKTSKNKYHVHRILMPDGSLFTYEAIKNNAELTGDSISEKNSGKRLSISSASDATISHPSSNVNTEDKNVTKLQNSVSEVAQETSEESTNDAYSELDSRAKRHLNGVEKTLARAFASSLNVDIKNENGREDSAKLKKFIEDAVRPITNEYLLTGTVSAHTISNVFEEYYKNPAGVTSTWLDQARMDARGMFERAIEENWNTLQYIRKYTEEKKREKAKKETAEPIEREEARRRFNTLLEMQKLERRAMRNNLLSNSDMLEVGRLLRGETSLDALNPVKHNVEGIRAVYEAKMQTKEASAAVSEYQRQLKARRYEKADTYLENALTWKDKATGIQYQRETLERNIMDIVPDRALAREIIREYVSPVHQHEANSTRWKTKLADRVRALDLSLKKSKGNTVSESYMVQFWGEANDNIKLLKASNDPTATRDGHTLEEWEAMVQNMWDSNPNVDQAKIKKAAEEFRKIYEEIFEEMNNVLLDNGYAPVPYRKGYFPHFTGEEETVLAKFGRLLGIKTEMVVLPTTINGLTENFKPGKTWFGHGQQRQGFYTTYDAVTGFEQYIKGAADVIFHTEDIQNLRALAKQIRYNASDEAIREKIEKTESNPTLDDAQKETLLAELRKEGKYKLSHFVAYLDEYTNKLANKKSRVDRTVESLFGRKVYVVMSNLESRVAANMIVANLGSALTNAIPVNQAAAQLGWDWMLKGMQSTYKNVLNGDSINEASSFLMNRRGYESLIQTTSDKISNVLGKPMELIDNLASEMIVRAAYAKNLDAGLTADEALYQADLFAASVMADRSKGSMPLIFESKNPLLKLFTQFQLEVNNEFSVLFKDIPRMERKRWQDHIAYVLIKYFVGAWLYNELYELIVGRRAALDPIGTVIDAVEEGVENGFGAGVKSAVVDTAEQLPFVGGVLGGGRVPISSALPDISTIWNAASSDWDAKKKAYTIVNEIATPLYYQLFPYGGGAIKKLNEAIGIFANGGKYSYDREGNAILQYPFYGDQGFMTAIEGARTLAFGKTSTEAGQQWVEESFGSLGAKQTAVYRSLTEAGIGEKKAYDFINELSDAKADIADTKTEIIEFAGIKVEVDVPVEDAPNLMSKAEVQRQMIRESKLNGDGRAIAYFGLLASESEQKLMVSLETLDADMGTVTDLLMNFKDAENTSEKLELLINANLEDDEKRKIYYDRISETRLEDINTFYDAGMDFDTYLRCNQKFNELYNGEGNASYKATQLARWINQNGFSADEKAVIEEAFKYYSMMPAKAQSYDELTEAGLDDETAYKITTALSDLEPLEGETRVSNVQKYRAVVDTVASPVYQMEALSTVMSESVYKKTAAAYSYGIEPESYVTYLERLTEYDKDGSGSLSQAEVETALDAISGNLSAAEKMTIALTGGQAPGILYFSDEQLAVLWQLSGNWSPKNNPYSVSVGEKVKKAMEGK